MRWAPTSSVILCSIILWIFSHNLYAQEPPTQASPAPELAALQSAPHDFVELELPEAIGETIVRPPDNPSTGGTSTIDRRQIEVARPASASEVMELVPGMRIVQHGAEGKAHQWFLRGFDAVHGSDVEVFMGFIPLNERLNVHGHGYVDLYGIVPEAIREMHVKKGPFMPEQGDFATAGSVVVEMGLPDSMRPGFVTLDVSHLGKLRLAGVVSPKDAPRDAFVAGEVVFDQGFGPERQATRGTTIGQWTFNVGPNLNLGIVANAQAAKWQSPGAVRLVDYQSDRIGFYDSYNAGGSGRSWRALVGLNLKRDGLGTNFETALWTGVRGLILDDNYTGYLYDKMTGDLRRQDQTGAFTGVSGTVNQPLPLPFPAYFVAGTGWRFDWGKQSEFGLLRTKDIHRVDRDLTAMVHGIHAFAGLRLKPWKWLDILPSIRGDVLIYDVDDHLGEKQAGKVAGTASPRIALTFPAHPMLKVFADYGRGFRTPEPRSVLAPPMEGSIGNESLSVYKGGRPTLAIADAAEIGLALKLPGRTNINVAGFGTWIDKEIVFDHVSNTNLEQNSTRRLGIEAAVSTMPLDWLRFQTDVTWVDARFEKSGAWVPGAAPWTGRVALDLGLKTGVHGGVLLGWSGTRHLAHGAKASGYAMLDLSFGYRHKRFDVTLLVENATSSKIMDGAYHYSSWFDLDQPRSVIPVIHYTAQKPTVARVQVTAYF
ncbi:MAG TPA: TonB-dependent receptor [Myxococcota bacterium]|nr:TonB-dependent receptor [Myxococcota bacterium]HRV17770.1 TonB-dependent receptor [Myxococcota bacterium]